MTQETSSSGIIPAALLDAMSQVQGSKMASIEGSAICPISEEIIGSRKESMQNLKPGDMVVGEGIFLCRYSPVDRQGKPLNKTFNVFAAPKDIHDEDTNRVMFTYQTSVKTVADLKKWHGHDGFYCDNDVDLYRCLESGACAGQWVIPPKELIDGRDVGGNVIQPDNMCAYKDNGSFQYSFMQMGVGEKYAPDWYWTCTKLREIDDIVWDVRLKDGEGSYVDSNRYLHSCRPVRFVEVKI